MDTEESYLYVDREIFELYLNQFYLISELIRTPGVSETNLLNSAIYFLLYQEELLTFRIAIDYSFFDWVN